MNRILIGSILLALLVLLASAAPLAAEEGEVFKVLVINFDPIIESEGGKRLHEVFEWKDPRELARVYVEDLKECSYGWAEYEIVEWIDADKYPTKIDGFEYTDETYLAAWKDRSFHKPDAVDYRKIIREYSLDKRVRSGEIDEVFMFGAPYFGYYESQMAGPGAYWCNSPGLPDIKSVRKFVIMGFNYERGVGEMLENYGHRTESIMRRVYGSWNAYPPKHNWDLFTLIDKNIKDRSLYTAGCGNVHYSPNSPSDYKWGETKYVWSTCDDWLHNWPNLKGVRRKVNCEDWGGGEIRAHHRWWFKHFPHAPGVNADGRQNNWWKYMADFNRYWESR